MVLFYGITLVLYIPYRDKTIHDSGIIMMRHHERPRLILGGLKFSHKLRILPIHEKYCECVLSYNIIDEKEQIR